MAEGEAEFEAEHGAVEESARLEAGYTETDRGEDAVEREYEGVDRTVVVDKPTEYSRAVDIPLVVSGELGRSTAPSSPEVTVVPVEPANPPADTDNDDLAEMG